MHRLDSLDLVSDQTPKMFGVGHAHAHDVAVIAGDAVQFFDFRNSRELCRGL